MPSKEMIDNMRGALGMFVKHANHLVKKMGENSSSEKSADHKLALDNPGMQGSSDDEQMEMDDSIVNDQIGVGPGDDDPMLPEGQGSEMEADISKITNKNPVHAHFSSKNILEGDDPEEREDQLGPKKGMQRLHHMGIPSSSQKRGKFERII